MHAKEQLAEQLGEAYGYISEMLDHKIEEVKLSAAEKSALAVSKLLTVVVVTIFTVVISTFGLISLAFYFAGDMQSSARGFGIVALIMLVLLGLVFLLRRYIIINPTVAIVINLFFPEPSKEVTHEQDK
jgi:ABC-type transport system involved in multi-copper enzyme maturation permease subunit